MASRTAHPPAGRDIRLTAVASAVSKGLWASAECRRAFADALSSGLVNLSGDRVEPDDRGDDRQRLLQMTRSLPRTRQEDGGGDPFR